MSNWSIGIDFIEVKRFREINIYEHPRFYERVFNEYEVKYCLCRNDPYLHFAGIFASKEAVFKAVNKFIKININDIFIYHDKKGSPFIHINKKKIQVKSRNFMLNQITELNIQVSISHSSDVALAWALAFINMNKNESDGIWEKISPKISQVINNEFQHQFV